MRGESLNRSVSMEVPAGGNLNQAFIPPASFIRRATWRSELNSIFHLITNRLFFCLPNFIFLDADTLKVNIPRGFRQVYLHMSCC
jgi:hypothetical protein